MKTRTIRRFVSLALAGLLTSVALPASAEEVPSPDSNYVSLAAAMTAFYAQQKGTTLAQYVNENPEQAAALLGLSLEDLKAMPTDSVGDLDNGLSKEGATLDVGAYSDLSTAKADLLAKSSTLDAMIVSTTATWASDMVALRSEGLTMPDVKGFDSSQANTMPNESLAFGLFLDRSLSDFVTSSPDVFASISSTGLGTAEAQKAWQNSMTKALSKSQGDLTSMLPSKCGGVFLTAMASGDASQTGKVVNGADDCGSCLITGLYSHGQMSALFDPSVGRVNPVAGSGTINPAEWQNMTSWQKNVLTNSNDSLSQALDSALGVQSAQGKAGGCEGSSATVKASASQTLQKTLSYLNK